MRSHSLHWIWLSHLNAPCKPIWNQNHNINIFPPAMCSADYLTDLWVPNTLSVNTDLWVPNTSLPRCFHVRHLWYTDLFYQPHFYQEAPVTIAGLSASRGQVCWPWPILFAFHPEHRIGVTLSDVLERTQPTCRPSASCVIAFSTYILFESVLTP